MRYHPREITPRIVHALETMPVVVLTGMCQVGKTTLVRTEPARRKAGLELVPGMREMVPATGTRKPAPL